MVLSRSWVAAAGVVILVGVVGAVARNQVKVYQNRQARAHAAAELQAVAAQQQSFRQALFDALQPVTVSNCQLERFGEAHDGGYLLCANLLGAVESGYSYGIAGYDKWGCDISTKLGVPLHQYDCFNTTQPACPGAKTVFHAECVGDAGAREEGRLFDTIANQLTKNGDRTRRIVMKMDVEGAEWDSLLSAPEDVLQRIDQLAIELHWVRTPDDRWTHDSRYLELIQRLKQYFHVAHLHFNNHSCVDGLQPFPAWAYEVLFVNKRVGAADGSPRARGVHPLDAPNDAKSRDCQP